MLDDYSNMTWDDVRTDSMRVRDSLVGRSTIKISTPGLGLGDNFQCCTAIRTIDEVYHPDTIVMNCYHPYLFENNPRCTVGTNTGDPENIVLHTWPHRKLPEHGILNGGRICSAKAYNIRVGAMDHPLNTDSEFYPTNNEIIWAAMNLSEYVPYVTVQLRGDPPRKFYNISPNLPRSDSDGRWMTSTDWYTDRWVELVARVRESGYNVLQIGCEHEELIDGCVDMRTVGVRKTFLVIGKAELHIGHDSFPQHAANAMETHALLFIAGRSNDQQHTNTTRMCMAKNLPCADCLDRDEHIDTFCTRECMNLITVDYVMEHVRGLLD